MTNDEKERVIAALTTDHHSQSAYTGRIKQRETVTIFSPDGTPIQKDIDIFITWDTVKAVLEMVRTRAKL